MKDNYIWKPNDNSASTRLKYELEAEQQVRAYNQAMRKHNNRDGENLIYLFGLFVVALVQITSVLIIGFSKLIAWLYNRNKNK